MIPNITMGRSFVGLGNYLATGKKGKESHRVAWSEGRNIPTKDPQMAAKIMGATAAQSKRVQKPVWHLSISWEKGLKADRENMLKVTDRALKDMGLDKHQAVIVAHNDTDCDHLHVMVNRVHPETLKAWNPWKDRNRVQKSMRTLERELGMRVLYDPTLDKDRERDMYPSRGERQRAKREGDTPKTPWDKEQILTVKNSLKEAWAQAKSWKDLDDYLAKKGYFLEAKGQGLIITNGTQFTQLSKMGKTVRLPDLEKRFGQSYRDHQASLEKQLLKEAQKTPDKSKGLKTQPGPSKDRENAINRALKAYTAVIEFKRYDNMVKLTGETLRETRKELNRLDYIQFKNKDRIEALKERFRDTLFTAYKEPATVQALWNELKRNGQLEKGKIYGELKGWKAPGVPGKSRALATRAAKSLFGLQSKIDLAEARQGELLGMRPSLAATFATAERQYASSKQALGTPKEKASTRRRLFMDQAKALREISEWDIFDSDLPDELKYRLHTEWIKRLEKDQARDLERAALSTPKKEFQRQSPSRKSKEAWIPEPSKPEYKKPDSWWKYLPETREKDPVMRLHHVDLALKDFKEAQIKTREAWDKVEAAKQRLKRLKGREDVSEYKKRAFFNQLKKIYKNAEKASKAWEQMEYEKGLENFVKEVEKNPEKLGELKGWRKLLIESAERREAKKGLDEAVAKRREWIEAIMQQQALEAEKDRAIELLTRCEQDHRAWQEKVGDSPKEETQRKKELEIEYKKALSQVTREEIQQSRILEDKRKRYLERLVQLEQERERGRGRGKGRGR